MNKHKLIFLKLLTVLFFGLSNTTYALTFYENNYESGVRPLSSQDPNNADPIWTMAGDFPDSYGPGNFFNLTNTTSHSGSYSLKITYEGLNGICNACGSSFRTHKAGFDNVDFFVSDSGEDLTISDDPSTTKDDDGPKAEPGKFIYNRNGGFSKWEIMSVTDEDASNDRINLKLALKGVNGETTFNSGDGILITRTCGVDGLIGIVAGKNDVNRRSDCNRVIAWFSNVTAQAPGDSIFRRSYYKAEITGPGIRQKLHYFQPDRFGPNLGSIFLIATSNTTSFPQTNLQLEGFSQYGGDALYNPGWNNGFDGMILERSIWYYIEEEFKAATVATVDPVSGAPLTYNADGEYRLWFSPSGSEPTENNPTFEITGLTLPPLTGGNGTQISFWGNNGHHIHNRGSWYIDDVIISNTWNGPVPQTNSDPAPPKAPIPTVKQ